MPKKDHHPSSEPRPILGVIRAARVTCSLCSWVWQLPPPDYPHPAHVFWLKRPNLMCGDEDHRDLLNTSRPVAAEPLLAWLQAS